MAGQQFAKWSEAKDEAHAADCVVADLALPAGSISRQVRTELSLKGLRIFVGSTLVFDDRFAEERWLQIDESYWEFVPEGPLLRYFFVKNPEFQQEPLYCLFWSELREPPPAEEDEDEEDEAAAENEAAALPQPPPPPPPASPPQDIEAEQLADAVEEPSLPAPPIMAVLEGVALCGGTAVSRDDTLTLCVWSLGDGVEEIDMDFGHLLRVGVSNIHVMVIGFGEGADGRRVNPSESVVVELLDGRGDIVALFEDRPRPDIVYVPVSVLECRYFLAAPALRRMAAADCLIIASGGPYGALSLATTRVVLQTLGCRMLLSGCESGLGEKGTAAVLCARGVVEGGVTVAEGYISIRRALSKLGTDFRPRGFPGGDLCAERPREVGQTARHALLALGASMEDAAVAAGVAAAEEALAALQSVAGSSRVQAAVSWGVRGTLEAGGAEARAAAVGAWLGLREGLYTWQPPRPLDGHGAEVANVVGTTLGAEGLWRGFSEAVRWQKISDLTRAGGLRRPGECSVALCQALLGMNRPPEGSRFQGALNVLRKVSKILLAQAFLPSMLDVEGSEVASFCATVLETMDHSRLCAFLQRGEAE